ncbi:MAG: type I-E CRISPR-associated protein Cse2/CasB [bacterium]
MSEQALTTKDQTNFVEFNFAELKTRFDSALSNGQRAEIRRVRDPDELDWLPSFYRLLPTGAHADRQWRRIIFLLPFARQTDGAASLGAQLAKAKVSEARLFQIIRSNYPNDFLYLRRILQQVQPSLDWQQFGKMLYYWGDNTKRHILEDYFLAAKPEK